METSKRRMEAPSEGGQGPEGAVAPWNGIENYKCRDSA